MKRLIFCLKHIILALYGFISACFTPAFLNIAFNFSHGIANNSDGAFFAPVGIVVVCLTFLIDVSIFFFTLIKKKSNKREKIILLVIFCIAKLLGYVVDFNGWKNFILCLQFYFN